MPDTIYLFRTTDKFENVNVINKFNLPNGIIIQLISGILEGELFSYNQNTNCLGLSSDYAENFELIDCFNFKDQYYFDMTGGRQTGELYILYSFVNMLWQNAHIYIYHSMDYGKTFEVFHPFTKGNEPVLANFSTDTTEGEMPFTVEFCNFSIGNIQQYEWDFDNDGIIDSYDETPTWIYQDTGYYSVRLTITGTDSSNIFLKENYIHVVKTTGMNETPQPEFLYYPNPFGNYIIFDFSNGCNVCELSIFDLSGRHINTIRKQAGITKVLWDGTDGNGVRCNPGIYFVKIEGTTFSKKILLTM